MKEIPLIWLCSHECIFHGLLGTHKKYIPAFLFLRDENKSLCRLCHLKNPVYINIIFAENWHIESTKTTKKILGLCLWSVATKRIKGHKVKVMNSMRHHCASLNFLAVLLYKNVFWPTAVNWKGHWQVKSDLLSPLLCYMFSSKMCFHVSYFYWKAAPRGQNPGTAWQS